MAFAVAAVAPLRACAFAGRAVAARPAPVPTRRRCRAARMAADGGDADGDKDLPAAGAKSAAAVEEDAVKQTWQGNAWFAVTMIGMLLGVVATLARDFVPSGGPAVY